MRFGADHLFASADVEPIDLITQLSGEVANTLASALDRVVDLTSTGRIDRRGLRALRDEIDQARRAGVMAQQVLRLGTGDVPIGREQLDLTLLVRKALQQHENEITARGFEVRHQLAQVELVSDATLVFSLLQTLLDWCLQHADSRIDLRLDSRGWPSQVRLACAFIYFHTDEPGPPAPLPEHKLDPRLNSMAWHLVEQTAAVLGLRLQRHDEQGRTQLVIGFAPQSANRQPVAGLYAQEVTPGQEDLQPLAGLRVLLLAQQPQLQQQVRDALRPCNLTLDVATTLEQAQQLSAALAPQAVVYELGLVNVALDIWLQHLAAQNRTLACICIDNGEKAFEVVQTDERRFARVSQASLGDALPAALLFELSQLE